ncbi:hypothetical protein CYMTET_34781, partial [Cymbomonas tetramitiformis]
MAAPIQENSRRRKSSKWALLGVCCLCVTNSLVLCGDVPMKNKFAPGTEAQHPNWPLQGKFAGTKGLDRRSVLDGYYCTAGPCTLASGRAHTCVVLQDTLSVRCFGQGEAGQLGYGSSESHGGAVGSMPPPGDIEVGAEVLQVAAGGDVSCVVTTRGGIRCWGARGDGSLGNPRLAGNLGDTAGDMPPADIELGDAAVQVSVGTAHVCALLSSGHVTCWGSNERGQLGVGTTTNVGLAEGDMPPTRAILGEDHTCAVTRSSGHVLWLGDTEMARHAPSPPIFMCLVLSTQKQLGQCKLRGSRAQ